MGETHHDAADKSVVADETHRGAVDAMVCVHLHGEMDVEVYALLHDAADEMAHVHLHGLAGVAVYALLHDAADVTARVHLHGAVGAVLCVRFHDLADYAHHDSALIY